MPVQEPTRGQPFYGYSEKPPPFQSPLGFGGHILVSNHGSPRELVGSRNLVLSGVFVYLISRSTEWNNEIIKDFFSFMNMFIICVCEYPRGLTMWRFLGKDKKKFKWVLVSFLFLENAVAYRFCNISWNEKNLGHVVGHLRQPSDTSLPQTAVHDSTLVLGRWCGSK